MLAQRHRKPGPFGRSERQALVVVIADAAVEAHGVLRQRQQPVCLGRDRDAGRVVQVHDAVRIGPRGVHGGVEGEAGHIDRVHGLADHLAPAIDLDEVRRADLVEREAERVDQEVVRLTGHGGGDMGVDQVVPALQRSQPVGGGEVGAHARLPGADGNSRARGTRGLQGKRHGDIRSAAALLRGVFQTRAGSVPVEWTAQA
ncbi:hypothetical protein D3C81_1493190 [compost metagenome]